MTVHIISSLSIFILCIYDDNRDRIYDHNYNYDGVVCIFLRICYNRISNITDMKLILTYPLGAMNER